MEKNMEEIFSMYKEFGIDTTMANSIGKNDDILASLEKRPTSILKKKTDKMKKSFKEDIGEFERR